MGGAGICDGADEGVRDGVHEGPCWDEDGTWGTYPPSGGTARKISPESSCLDSPALSSHSGRNRRWAELESVARCGC